MYEFIIKVLESGHWIGVKHENGKWKVFTYVRPNGKLEGMSIGGSIKDSLNSGLNPYSYTKEEIEQYFTNEYQIVPRIPKPYRTGDLVDILDTPEVREYVKDYGELSLEIVGQKGLEIMGIEGMHIRIYLKDKSDWYTFPYLAVAPHFKEEPKVNLTDEELIKELTKRNLTVEGKVLK